MHHRASERRPLDGFAAGGIGRGEEVVRDGTDGRAEEVVFQEDIVQGVRGVLGEFFLERVQVNVATYPDVELDERALTCWMEK